MTLRLSARTMARLLGVSLTAGGAVPTAAQVTSRDIAAPVSAELQSALDHAEAYTRQGMERWGVPGLAMGIVKDGVLVYAKGFGYRDAGLTSPLTARTAFGLASNTKAFTAVICGLMVEDGVLGWDSPLVDHVPDLSLVDPELTRSVTLRDVLSHRTGLNDKSSLWTSGDYRAEEIFGHLDELEIGAPLRERFEYSNVMYIAAAVTVEKLMGESWDVVGRRRLLEPLGMTATGFSVESLLKEPEYSVSYSLGENGYEANDFPGPEHNAWYYTRGSGSMYSTVADLSSWLAVQLDDGRYEGRQIVAPETVRATHTPSITLGEPPFYMDYPGIDGQSYGMGWFIDEYRGHHRVHHGGASMGYSNYITLFPDDGIGIVILSNREVMFPVELMYYVGDLLLGLEPADWEARFAEYNPAG